MIIDRIDRKVERINKERCPRCNTSAVFKIEGYCWTCWNCELSEFQKFFIIRNNARKGIVDVMNGIGVIKW